MSGSACRAVEKIEWGDNADNCILGTGKQDHLGGMDGKDALSGKAGRDVLEGGKGADTLDGGFGANSLKGGVGADVFVFSTALNASTNVDQFADFTSGTDHFSLFKSEMRALGSIGMLSSSAFWSGPGAIAGHDATDRIGHNPSTGVLYHDVDGNRSCAAVEIAVLMGRPSLLNTDTFVF